MIADGGGATPPLFLLFDKGVFVSNREKLTLTCWVHRVWAPFRAPHWSGRIHPACSIHSRGGSCPFRHCASIVSSFPTWSRTTGKWFYPTKVKRKMNRSIFIRAVVVRWFVAKIWPSVRKRRDKCFRMRDAAISCGCRTAVAAVVVSFCPSQLRHKTDGRPEELAESVPIRSSGKRARKKSDHASSTLPSHSLVFLSATRRPFCWPPISSWTFFNRPFQ